MSTKTLFTRFVLLAYAIHVSALSNGTVDNTFDTRADPLCPPGKWSPTRSPPCYDCLPGWYNKNYGALSCTMAEQGYYVPTSGASSQTECRRGTYSDVLGSIACKDCTPGNYCPYTGMDEQYQCPTGTFSSGGASSCTDCPPGSFTSEKGSRACCPCCANFYVSGSGKSKCDKCPSNRPYSNPGSTSSGQCVSSPQLYVKQDECKQSSPGTCPASPPVSSPLPRRSLIRKPQCKPRQKICPVFGSYTRGGPLTVSGYDCVDVHNDLESCGGCVDESRDGRRSEDGGRDCSAIPHIDAVRCEGNRCIIDSCRRGFVKSVDGEHCVPLQGGLHLQDPQFML